MKASLLFHREEFIGNGKYVTIIKVYQMERSWKFPNGIKAKLILKNNKNGFVRLLIDNHPPYGFHIHTRLPHDHEHREMLAFENYEDAITFFNSETERIVKDEEA